MNEKSYSKKTLVNESINDNRNKGKIPQSRQEDINSTQKHPIVSFVQTDWNGRFISYRTCHTWLFAH